MLVIVPTKHIHCLSSCFSADYLLLVYYFYALLENIKVQNDVCLSNNSKQIFAKGNVFFHFNICFPDLLKKERWWLVQPFLLVTGFLHIIISLRHYLVTGLLGNPNLTLQTAEMIEKLFLHYYILKWELFMYRIRLAMTILAELLWQWLTNRRVFIFLCGVSA